LSEDSLAGKTALVTGATGFVGGAVVRRLAADGVMVKALARSPRKAQPLVSLPNVEIVYGDITDIRQMREVIAGCDVVFHVAAALGGKLDHQLDVNLGGTRNVAVASSENNVQRLVHVSSIAIYGYYVRGIVTEDTPQNPGKVPYNVSKLEAERVLRKTAEETGLPYSIVRPGTIYGAGSGAWTKGMMRLAKLKPTPFIGEGSAPSYLIHIDDLVDLMLVQATHPAADGEAFNCVMNPAPTWREYLGKLQALSGHDRWLAIPVPLMVAAGNVVEPFLHLKGEPQDVANLVRYVADDVAYSMDKAKTLLGWETQVSLDEGIQRSIPYLQEIGLL